MPHCETPCVVGANGGRDRSQPQYPLVHCPQPAAGLTRHGGPPLPHVRQVVKQYRSGLVFIVSLAKIQ